MSSPDAPPALTVAGTSYPLRWDMRALFRLQGLPDGPDLGRIDEQLTLRTMLQVLWAALPREAALRYPTPEELATALGRIDADTGERVAHAFQAALAEALPTEEKKSATSTSLSPASSSG